MLRTVKSLEGFAIDATDGTIGKVKNLYFDDQAWVIRYFVVDTKQWLGGREVLISPYSISQPNWAGNVLPSTISKQQVKESPSIDTDKPVSRQYEAGFLGFYGYPYYWGASGLWGSGYYPAEYLDGATGFPYSGYQGFLGAPSGDEGDPHLRSCNEVKGYHLKASDGDIGHVQGYLVDDSTWSIRYLIVKTTNWWIGHDVLVSPEWIEQVKWRDREVVVSLDRDTIKNSPVYDPSAPYFLREEEEMIYRHYGRNPYWQDKRDRSVAA